MLTNSGGEPGAPQSTGVTAAAAAPAGGSRTKALVATLATLAALALAAGMLRRLWPFTVDDTFITLRYARHLADGIGPVWNRGPVHDEGYTSPLWTVLLALPLRLGLDGERAAKLLSVLAQCGTVAACWALARIAVRAVAPGAAPAAALLAALLYALDPGAAVHAVSGMETAAFALAIGLLAWSTAGALETGARLRPWRLAALALVTGLLRPEGNLVALVMLTALAVMLEAPPRGRLLRAILLGWALPGAIYFAWRWNYYGAPLPLPFYLKLAGAAPLAGLPRVAGYAGNMLLAIGVPLAIGLAPVPRPLRPALAGALALLLFFVFPEHLMGYHARYLVPAAPILFALTGAGLARLEVRLAARASRSMAVAVIAALAVACGFALLSRAPAVIADRRFYAEGYDRAHRALAARLANLPPGRIALSDAGIIPYRTDWTTLDLVGLNDRHIARTHDRSVATVFAFEPEVLVLASQEADRFHPFGWNGYEAALLDAAMARGFRFAERYRFHDRYWLWVLVDPGSDTGRALLSATPGP